MSMTTVRLLDEVQALGETASPEALGAAQLLTKDLLGVAVAGTATEPGEIVRRYAVDTAPRGAASVIGIRASLDASSAALANGTCAYAIGLTDTHTRSITHPGSSVIPAALAVAESVGASGRDYLTAVVIGCEVATRIGMSINPSHRARGFHPSATCNVFGVVAAAGHLMGLRTPELASAMGIAGSMASGIYEFRHSGSMLMALHAGWPAKNGIIAAELAARGFTGPATVLEGEEGFLHAFADAVDLDALAVDSAHPQILEIGLRPYNACRYGHSAIDALLAIEASSGPLHPRDIAAVTVWTHRTAVEQEADPSTVVGARLSIAYAVARTLAHGPQLSEVTESDLRDELVLSLMDRVEVRESPELTALFPAKWACRVEILTRGGERYLQQVDVPKGEPSNPMTSEEIGRKFRALVEPVFGAATDELERELARIPEASDLWGLGDALALRKPAEAEPRPQEVRHPARALMAPGPMAKSKGMA